MSGLQKQTYDAATVNYKTTRGIKSRKLAAKMDEVITLNDFDGIVAGGAGCTDSIVAAIAKVEDGTIFKIKGYIKLDKTLFVTRRIGFVCESKTDAFITDVGVLNDGIYYQGSATGINNIKLDINVYGAANSCKNGVVLQRVDRSPNIYLNVHTGAVEYGVYLRGMLINNIFIDSSVNYVPPYPNCGFQKDHVRIDKTIGVAFNANDLYVNLEGGGKGIIGENMQFEGNNHLSGTIEGLLDTPLSLFGWLGASITDMHLEANAKSPVAENCTNLQVGKGVLNPKQTTPFLFKNCNQLDLDGYFGEYITDDLCSFVRVGRMLSNSDLSAGKKSYYNSGEQVAAIGFLGSANVVYGGMGSFTLENVFHNPFMDVWTNGAFSAPDGVSLTNATCQSLAYPSPCYVGNAGRSCEVTVSAASPNIYDGALITSLAPYNVGLRGGSFVSVLVPVFVKAGQPDVAVYMLASGVYTLIGRVTEKDAWVEVRGGVAATAEQPVSVRVVPWNFGTGVAMSGKFILGGMSMVLGVRSPKHLCNHGRRENAIVSRIDTPPSFVGQRAMVAGRMYHAVGVAASTDWK